METTFDDVLHAESVQRENAEDKYMNELKEIIDRMLQNNLKLRYMFNNGDSETRDAIKEAITVTHRFFEEN